MGEILDARVVEEAELIRIVIYPNIEREKEMVFPPDWELKSDEKKKDWAEAYEPTYEYYDKLVNTYKLKDGDGKTLPAKQFESEVGLSDKTNTLTETQTALGKDLKTKVAADILTLSGKII